MDHSAKSKKQRSAEEQESVERSEKPGIAKNNLGHQSAAKKQTRSAKKTPVKPSSQTIEQEIEYLLSSDESTRADIEATLRRLRNEIEESKQVEESLREKSYELDRFFALVPDLVCIASTDGYFKKLNDAWKKTLGFTKAELLSEPFESFIHPDDIEQTRREVARQIDGQSTIKFVNRYRTKEGGYRWLEWVTTPAVGQSLYAAARDITDRRQVEEALRESEERFRIIFNNAADGLVLTDVDDRKFHSCNKMFSDMLGYSEEEIKNLAVMDIHPKEDLPYIIEQFKRLANEETAVNNDIPVKRKDGSVFYADIRAMPIDLSGKRYLIGIFRDITERRRSEEILHQSEERFRALTENTSDWIWEVDQSFVFTYTSPKVKDLLGYEPNEIIGKTPFDLMPEHEAKRISDIAHSMLASHEPFTSLENINLRKDGRQVILETSGVPTFDKDGKFSGYRGIDRDITERKRAEEALRVSEEKYRLVVENANDAIFIAQDGKIKFSNTQLANLSGYSEEELTKVTFSDFLHAEDKDMVVDRHQRRLRGEEVPATYSFRVINKAGETLWVEAHIVLINWEGRPASLNFLRDITIQKKLEEQLLHAQKMEAVGTLAGGVAHDFNNLLMGILGYTSLMLMKIDEGHPFYEKLKTIERQVESGAELTRQLLGFARGGKYEIKPVNVNDLIIKTADVFGRTKKEIVVYKKLQENLYTTEADAGQLEQVLFNLYVNAWQAMPSGGRLYIETENVILDEQYCRPFDANPGPYVKIQVRDTGIGMDPETQKRIFEPFFSTKGIGKGTGLGLASAYGIIRNHGGIINLYSEKGHGTTFNIYLPASGKEPLVTKPSESSPLTGHETILLVDDEPLNTETVKELLRALGYRIMTAQSGQEAIEIYREHHGEIGLVILDMIMPEMNGRETLIKLMEIDKNVRVLLSSGYSINGEAKSILELGCKGFIQKPFRVEELSRKIRAILDSGDS
jgi:two-component system, cell cycle sensor histidine kinase and response regulator CckA